MKINDNDKNNSYEVTIKPKSDLGRHYIRF